jgi:hypothetical protein
LKNHSNVKEGEEERSLTSGEQLLRVILYPLLLLSFTSSAQQHTGTAVGYRHLQKLR